MNNLTLTDEGADLFYALFCYAKFPAIYLAALAFGELANRIIRGKNEH